MAPSTLPTLRPCLPASVPPSLHPSIHPSIHPPIRPCIQPAIHPSAHPPSFLPSPSLPSSPRSFLPGSSLPAAPCPHPPRISPHSRAPSLQLPGRAKGNKPPVAPSADGQGEVIGSASSQAGRQAGGQGRAGQCRAWHGRREGGREGGRGREGARTRPDGPKERRRRCPNAQRLAAVVRRDDTDGWQSQSRRVSLWGHSNNGLHALWVRSRRADAQSSSRLAPSSPLRRRRP